MSQELVINATSHESRIAVLDEGQVVELWVERQKQRTVVGNIYKGRVTKVLPGMQSAFVDVGLERDAFLYVSDVVEDFEEYEAEHTEEIHFEDQSPRPEASISDLLREGQEIVVQVSKDSIAGKGARITTHITLPGRFLVYMPTVSHIGVSRRIEDETERARLKLILEQIRIGPGGFIVRTAGEGKNDEEFRADQKYLTGLWEEIKRRAEKASSPTALHHDLDLDHHAMRGHLVAQAHMQRRHPAGARCGVHMLHLHGFECQQRLAGADVSVSAEHGDVILALWRATHESKADQSVPAHVRELHAGMIAWLERCRQAGWRLVKDA